MHFMKLAEALVLRADAQKRIEQLRARLQQSALVQENERPPEDPQTLLTELENLLAQLEELVERINRTNLRTSLPDGTTLTAALARRDVLQLHYGVLRGLADSASKRMDRYSRAEIRSVPTVNVAHTRRQMDGLARDRRELDTAIQEINWTTELAE